MILTIISLWLVKKYVIIKIYLGQIEKMYICRYVIIYFFNNKLSCNISIQIFQFTRSTYKCCV